MAINILTTWMCGLLIVHLIQIYDSIMSDVRIYIWCSYLYRCFHVYESKTSQRAWILNKTAWWEWDFHDSAEGKKTLKKWVSWWRLWFRQECLMTMCMLYHTPRGIWHECGSLLNSKCFCFVLFSLTNLVRYSTLILTYIVSK